MRLMRRVLFIIIVIAGIGYLLYARFFRPIPVVGYEVATGNLIVEVMGTGTVEAKTSTIVSSNVQGRLIELEVDQGDHVKSGQVIARIDDSDLLGQVEIAQANVEAAEASLDRLKADRARAQAVLRQALREDERVRNSFEQGAATASETDKSEEQVAIAQAGIASSEAAIAEGQKLLITARKTLEFHQAVLDDTIILAPFDGLIVRRARDPGDIVVPSSTIYQLIALDEIWVSAWVDETAMAALAPDQAARVVLRSEPDHPYPGHVVRLGRETDPETREFIVDVAIERLPKNWAIGQRAEAYIETNRFENILVMPLIFITVIDGERGVFVDQNGRAVWRACEFGARGRELIEIVDGIANGATVVRLADVNTSVQLSNRKRIVIE